MRGKVLIALFALMACVPQVDGGDTGIVVPPGDRDAESFVEVPENAIRVSDMYYMVPLAERVQGCRAYRPFSPTRRVQQAIHYRTADGRFVTDRGRAACE